MEIELQLILKQVVGSTFNFCDHDTIFVESVSKGKIGWEIAPKIVSCDRTFNIYTGV